MDKLNAKETGQNLKVFLESVELTSNGEQLKEILFECIMVRTKKSLEHLKRFIEIYYHDIIKPLYLSENVDSG